MRREQTKINNIRNKNKDIQTSNKEIQGIIRNYFETYLQIDWRI
jgi:hypothetical protein